MDKFSIIEAIELSLENMNKDYCLLSNLRYNCIKASNSTIKILEKEKFLERPFAYEFYHQLRKLLDNGDVNFGGPIIQAEVDKRYQKVIEKDIGKIPDFIIHSPSTDENVAIIELKLATRGIKDIIIDFRKIKEFKTNSDLLYLYGIEVLIGDSNSIGKKKKKFTI